MELEKLPDISEIKMEGGDSKEDEYLPNITLLTTLSNSSESTLLVLAESIINLDYPKEKWEWILIDDSEKSLSYLVPQMSNIKYFHFNEELMGSLHKNLVKKLNSKKSKVKKVSISNKMRNKINKRKKKLQLSNKIKDEFKDGFKRLPEGMKWNIGVQIATNDIIVHVGDDNYLPPKSIKHKIRAFSTNKRVEVVGANVQSSYYPAGYLSLVNGLPTSFPLHKRVYPNSLVYTKKYWKENKFNNQDDNIYNFLNKRSKKFKFINGTDLSVQLITKRNAILYAKQIRDNEPNGWHFPKISDDLFKKISKIQ
jgi:cellulose synthase/poly-beta-1,6-N-acetylglucosamine synthase-like glycosyltransferase